jgi:hypothetical protein
MLLGQFIFSVGQISTVIGGAGGLAGILSKLTGTFSLVSGAFASLGGIFATVSTFVTGTLIPAIVSLVSTFGLPIAIIGAVIGAGYLLVKNWDMVKEGAKALGEWISKTFNSIKENVSKAMGEFIKTGKDNIKRLSSDLSSAWSDIKNTCATKWNEIYKTVTQAISNFVKTGVDNVKALYNDLKTQFNNIKDTCSRVFSKIGEILVAPFRTAKKTIALTGTLLNGYADGIYYILYRMYSKKFKKDGYSYRQVDEFVNRYGVKRQTNTYENRQGWSQLLKKSRKVLPGVSPKLFTEFLLDKAIFISLSDMSNALPKYTEHPIPI